MGETWLIIDAPNSFHRARYTTGQLDEGVIYGFLAMLLNLERKYQTKKVVFCFDYGKTLREQALAQFKPDWEQHLTDKKIERSEKKTFTKSLGIQDPPKPSITPVTLPQYKGTRAKAKKTWSEEEWDSYNDLQNQMELLRTTYLAELGYNNIFFSEGFEADDIIASVCLSIPQTHKAVIVSSDKDFYQCLRENIIMHKGGTGRKPPTEYTLEDLKKDYHGLTPEQWYEVKSIAGCEGDDVPGVDGVGDVTAAKFVRGLLKETSASYQKIIAAEALWHRNLQIVKLPYEGTPKFPLVENEATQEKFRAFALKMDMPSLLSGGRSMDGGFSIFGRKGT